MVPALAEIREGQDSLVDKTIDTDQLNTNTDATEEGSAKDSPRRGANGGPGPPLARTNRMP